MTERGLAGARQREVRGHGGKKGTWVKTRQVEQDRGRGTLSGKGLRKPANTVGKAMMSRARR